MTVGITGASGFIGEALIAEVLSHNDEVVGFSRNPKRKIGGCAEVREFPAAGRIDLQGMDALVHLAGEPVFGVWTEKKKQSILESRVESTRRVVESLFSLDAARRPKVFACASGIGIYGNRGDEWLDEESDAGFGFLAEVSRKWEAEACKAEGIGIRTIILRIGMVLGERGGALPVLRQLFSKGLGGNLGGGGQWMSWIHIDDAAALFRTCLVSETIRGPVNVTSPNPVTNRDFTRILASGLKRKPFLPVPAFALKALPGGMEEMFLNSLRVEPTVMKSRGFKWQYPDLESAIHSLI